MEENCKRAIVWWRKGGRREVEATEGRRTNSYIKESVFVSYTYHIKPPKCGGLNQQKSIHSQF